MKALIRIPQLGRGLTKVNLVEWLVPDGTTVTAGTPIYSIGIDKSFQAIEAPVAGILQVVAEAGETYDVGHLVARIDVD